MTHSGPGAGDSPRADVELRVPADSAYVSVLRTTTAGLAARLDFTLDDIEDLRMAVGEASAIVLDAAAEGADLTARFWLGQRTITVRVEAPGTGSELEQEDDFAWQVLTTLADEAKTETVAGTFAITLLVTAAPLESGV
ncbi:anti-sigma factor [Nocardioides sp.]|jgi:serine/threonine-protein kinase RsbW|uniref:anti-sigma factor n=1 Tax=Nocardioides sp. TaxID=35761 RepID=UPI002C4031C0|nr:anti-sigma factor [Nocardioides sp.]HVX55432.1 anti-sigma factor [Nocardioides sp.]